MYRLMFDKEDLSNICAFARNDDFHYFGHHMPKNDQNQPLDRRSRMLKKKMLTFNRCKIMARGFQHAYFNIEKL